MYRLLYIITDQQNTTLLSNTTKQLKSICEKYKVYQSINVLNLNGDIVASSVKGKDHISRIAADKKPFNLSERKYFKMALQGEVYVSDALMSKVTNSPIVCISAPILSEKVLLVRYIQ